MVRYRLLDHTADLGFTCEGKTLPALFATAADPRGRNDPLGQPRERQAL